MRLFTESAACKSGLCCKDCRDTTERGDHWRATLARGHILPPDGVRFACPRGVPWGYSYFTNPLPPPMPIPDDFDPLVEVRRLKAGGCCGKPSTAPE